MMTTFLKTLFSYLFSRQSFLVAPFVNELSGLPVVSREDYLVSLCRHKRVLHFGFLDTPFLEQKIKKGSLLHLKIKKVASFLFGVDIDGKALKLYRKFTRDESNFLWDVEKGPLPESLFAKKFAVIFCPEVLEHLINPGLALARLKRICAINPSAKLIITVPNAFFAWGFFAANFAKEVVHPDHNYYFSPVTICRLLKKVGFTKVKILMYTASSMTSTFAGITQNGIIAECHC